MADVNDLTQNVNIWNDEKSKSVTVTTDDVKERLDVSIQDSIGVIVEDSESPTKYQLQSDYDAVGVSLNTSTDTVLFTHSGQGTIDLISVNSLTSSNYEVAILIDGTERIRITMADLGSNLGLTNSDYDLAVETANKQFRYHPASVGFTTSFTVKAKATVASPNVRHLILYKERIT